MVAYSFGLIGRLVPFDTPRVRRLFQSTIHNIRLYPSGNREACLTMVYKLLESASKRWRALNGSGLLADVIAGVVFVDGEKKENAA